MLIKKKFDASLSISPSTITFNHYLLEIDNFCQLYAECMLVCPKMCSPLTSFALISIRPESVRSKICLLKWSVCYRFKTLYKDLSLKIQIKLYKKF